MNERFEKIGLLTARAGNGDGYSIEVHRSSGCKLNVLYRRWHVLSFYPKEQIVERIGRRHQTLLVQPKAHVGIYPAGTSETVIWKGQVEGLHLHIDPETIRDEHGQIVTIQRIDGFQSQRLTNLLSSLYEEVRSKNRRNLNPEGNLVALIRLELKHISNFQVPQFIRPRVGKTGINVVLDCMHGPQAVTSTVESLSEVSALSRAEFSRQFRRLIGTSPHDYLVRSRIEQCKHAIYSGQRRLADIALENGFYDQAHFTKTFKKLVGLTPTEYESWFDR